MADNPTRCAPASTAWPRATGAAAATRTAVVVGASGLVGGAILDVLLADEAVTAVHAPGRRPLARRHARLTSSVIDLLAPGPLPHADEAYIALGTTIAVAGSQAAFRAVDHDAVLTMARAARSAGITRLGVVSALGADPASRVFYNRVKGEMERDVAALGLAVTVFARPSLLDGDRGALAQPARPGERWSLALLRPFGGLVPAAVRPIAAADVARGLIRAVRQRPAGVHIVPSAELRRLAHEPA